MVAKDTRRLGLGVGRRRRIGCRRNHASFTRPHPRDDGGQPTPKDKGLQLTLSLVAYDNGMIQLDGVPINAEPDYDSVDGWLGVVEVAVATINEFRRQVVARRRRTASDAATGSAG